MASPLRLCGSNLFSKILRGRSGMLPFVRPVTLKAQPAPPQIQMGEDERNMKLRRPISPHITIHSWQMNMTLSISHRITGFILTAYTIGLGCGALFLPDSIPHYIDSLANVNGGVLFMVKFTLAFPMTYHFFSGIRHLLWDMGKFFTVKEIATTGYIMLGLAVASAILFAAM